MKHPLQLQLRPRQPLALRLRQRLAGAVDVKSQHRERRTIGAGLAARTAFRRALQGGGDPLRVAQGEDALSQIERVAFPRYALRPALSGCLSDPRLESGFV